MYIPEILRKWWGHNGIHKVQGERGTFKDYPSLAFLPSLSQKRLGNNKPLSSFQQNILSSLKMIREFFTETLLRALNLRPFPFIEFSFLCGSFRWETLPHSSEFRDVTASTVPMFLHRSAIHCCHDHCDDHHQRKKQKDHDCDALPKRVRLFGAWFGAWARSFPGRLVCLNPNGTGADEAAHEALSAGYGAEKGAGSHTNLKANGRFCRPSYPESSASFGGQQNPTFREHEKNLSKSIAHSLTA